MILCVSGKARSGKDTFAKMLAEELYRLSPRPYIMMAYATELKSDLQKYLDLSYAQLWGDKKEVEDRRYPKSDGNGFWTGREMMQHYGQSMRELHYDFWVDRLFRIIDEKKFNNVIITDARHPNEVDAVLSRDGYHIKIVRPDKEKVHNELHISETALEKDYKVDVKIINDGTLEDLKAKAKGVAKTISSLDSLRNKTKGVE